MKIPLSRSELGLWIAENMPALDAELGPKSHDQCRELLNEITGLDIKDTDSIQDTLPKYLARLKELSGK
jgi:hypothetical protein